MPPRLGEGGRNKPTPKQVDSRKKRNAPDIPLSKIAPGLARATAPVKPKPATRIAAKAPVRPPKRQEGRHPGHGPVIAPGPSPEAIAKAQMAQLSKKALAATRKKQTAIIRNQHPSLLNADVLGISNIVRTAAHPKSILAGSVFQPPAHPTVLNAHPNVSAGIVFPTGGKVLSKVGEKLGFGSKAAAEAAAPAAQTGGVMAPGAAFASRETRRSAYEVARKIRNPQPLPGGGGFGPSLLSEQKAINRVTRGKRAAAYEEKLAQGKTHEQAMAELSGKFQSVPLPANYAPGWSEPQLKYLKDYTQSLDHIETYDKIRVKETLNKIAAGEVPQRAEVKLLFKTFGSEFERLNKQMSAWLKTKEGFHNIVNMPRELMATADISGTFRQALLAGVRYPDILAKNIGPELRAFKSEDYYNAFIDKLKRHPLAEQMNEGGLRITTLTDSRAMREEVYQSPYTERIPGIGHVARASGRAYTGLLDGVRVDMFERIYTGAEAAGVDVTNKKFLTSLAEFVNNATGQGGKSFGRHAASLNTFFWSPRLMASRINMFNPVYYAHLHPFVRAQALRSLGHFMGAMGIILGAAAYAGAKVELDPRSSDFGKIRIGQTRVDTLGGFQQPGVLAAREITGKKMNTSTGVLQTLGPGIGHQSRWDVLENFARGKVNPVFGVPVDYLHGANQIGQPFSWTQEGYQHLVPLAIQDALGQSQWPPKPSDIAPVAGGYAGSAVGLGVQSYAPRTSAVEKKAIQDAKDSGLWAHVGGKLPQKVSEDIQARSVLDAKLLEVGSGDHQYRDKLGIVIPEYVKKYPQYEAPLKAAMNKYKDNETALDKMYLALLHGSTSNGLPPLYPMLEKWTAAIHYFNERKATGG